MSLFLWEVNVVLPMYLSEGYLSEFVSVGDLMVHMTEWSEAMGLG